MTFPPRNGGDRPKRFSPRTTTPEKKPFSMRSGAPRTSQPVVAAKRALAEDGTEREGDRIAKLLARAGVGSRRDIERMIAEGRIAIQGVPLETPATIVESLKGITVDDRPVAEVEATRLFLFHKPAGFLTAARDPGGRPTIFDILPPGLPRLMPVGRLDMNTEGLLLLTNDGGLKRALELPASGVPRQYRVRAMGDVRQADLEALAMGVTIEGIRYGSIDASVDRRARADGANIWLTMRLAEGKNREVRRVCDAMGLKVSRLIRTAYGPFQLGDLPARSVEEASDGAVSELKRSLGVG